MARSIEESPEAQRRGYIPPQNDKERFLMRHIEDLARTAESRGIPRYSSFLSDREQVLARAALAKAGCGCWRLEGGYPEAERRLAAIEPEGSWADSPLACVRLECRAAPGVQLPAHRDYLGSLMGLALKREALGDIVLPADRPGTAYVFALEPAARLICEELVQVGRAEVSCTRQPLEEQPDLAPAEREKRAGVPMVVLSTASPFKFPRSVLAALGRQAPENDFEAMQALEQATGRTAPASLAALKTRTERFDAVIEPAQIADVALGYQA